MPMPADSVTTVMMRRRKAVKASALYKSEDSLNESPTIQKAPIKHIPWREAAASRRKTGNL